MLRPARHPLTTTALRLAAGAAAAILGIVLLVVLRPAPARAATTQISIFEDDTQMFANPGQTLTQIRQLGAGTIRLMTEWDTIAPSANRFKEPARFNAANPAAYPAANWAPYDAIIRDATADGINVDLDAQGGAPLWATGTGQPTKVSGYPFHNWEPSAAQYGLFVRALATRYSGDYDPVTNAVDPGNPADLPRVSFWSLWNEPDYGPSLAPQALPGHPGVEDSPRMLRALLDAGWSALQATGHAGNTIIWGELTPRNAVDATNRFGMFNGMWPLVFLRALYCVNSSYHELRGTAAAIRGCPTSAAASARFRSQNPVLFKAAAISDHPYQDGLPPNEEVKPSPNGTGLTEIGQLERALVRLNGLYGVHRTYPIYVTEFGYITSPPKPSKGHAVTVTLAQAAYYDNWSEYVMWKNPLIMSFDQYLLQDPDPTLSTNKNGGFASGLSFWGGNEKPGYDAWLLPIYLPVTTTTPGTELEVWGAARPSHFAEIDVPQSSPTVDITFEPRGTRSFELLDSVQISSPEGYFDTNVIVPSSGIVQLSYTYPDDPLLGDDGVTALSRPVEVTVN